MAETKTYTVLSGGESVYEVARKLDIPFQELIDHNGLENPELIPEATVLHLPYAIQKVDHKPIRYEILEQPRKMHVLIEGGIKKFTFASAQKWTDVQVTGPTYPFNANVEVVAIAHVPLTGEEGEPTAMYYMDALALGFDFELTGRPAYTIGFNHSQLADGHVEQVKKPIPPEREQRIKVLMQSDKDHPSPGLAALPTTELDYREVEDATKLYEWVSTYVPYPDGPKMYVSNEEGWVHEHMGKRSDKLLKKSQDVLVAGTFVKDDVEYGRPLQAAKSFLWYGVPMSNLISEEELYNTNIPLHERVGLPYGRLSPSERYITVPLARAISKTTLLKANLDKIKTRIGDK